MKNLLSPRLRVVASMAIFGTIGLFVRNIALPSAESALREKAHTKSLQRDSCIHSCSVAQ